MEEIRETLQIIAQSMLATTPRILWAIARISKQLGILLNRGKCSYVAMNGNNVIRFADGTRLTKCAECTYLGHHITQSLNVRQEENMVQAQAILASSKLHP